MNVIICGSGAGNEETLREAVCAWAAERNTGEAVNVTCFSTGWDLLDRCEAGLRADVLLAELRPGGEEEGAELARALSGRNPGLQTVFVANADGPGPEFCAEGTPAVLRRPLGRAKTDACLDRLWHRYCLSRSGSALIATRSQTVRLPFDSILFAEAMGHSVRIRTTDGPGEYLLRVPFSEVLSLLPPDRFVRCHRSYVVHLGAVRLFTRKEITLSGGDVIPVSRTCREEFQRRFSGSCRTEERV